jgi:aspartyl-tRNA(Asn)/glutamyl-tRNA(Gln) amidotransferase subunit C
LLLCKFGYAAASFFYFKKLGEKIMFDVELTKHLAELSKIEFTDDELNQMTADMTDIINLMDKVCEFDTSKKTYALDAVDYEDLRKDEHRDSYPTEKIVKNAKNIKNNSFVVPKVV